MNRWISIKFCIYALHRHWYRRGVVWNCKWDNFIQKQHSYGPWFMSKMHLNKILNMHRYIYMIYIYPITFCFSSFFNRVTALDLCTKCVSPKYLPNKWLHFKKILLVLSKFKMHTKNERRIRASKLWQGSHYRSPLSPNAKKKYFWHKKTLFGENNWRKKNLL